MRKYSTPHTMHEQAVDAATELRQRHAVAQAAADQLAQEVKLADQWATHLGRMLDKLYPSSPVQMVEQQVA